VLATFGVVETTEALRILALGLLILLPLTVTLCVWRVPVVPDKSRTRVDIRQGFAAIRQNRPFLRLIAAFLINGWANGLPATLFVLFVTHVLVAPDMVGPLLLLYFLSGVVAIPGWVWLSRRISKHRVWVGSMTLACTTFVWVPLLGAGDIWLFAVVCVVSGFAVGADLVLPAAIQADVVDVDTADTGEQRTGLYFALWSLATKLSLALAAGVAFPLLAIVGFQADTAPGTESLNTSGSLFAVSMLYAGLPVILKLPALVLMWKFPLSREAQEDLQARISATVRSS
ncbi:MAG: MFS transporter, partial [Candidatus Phaeomarinobacter sp.]